MSLNAFTRARLVSFLVVVAMVSFSQPLQHHDEHHKCAHDKVLILYKTTLLQEYYFL